MPTPILPEHSVTNIPTGQTPTTNPQIVKIISDAIAKAEEVGQVPLGYVTADITTAYVGDKRDDQSSESTLSKLIAQSMVDVLNDPQRSCADIGLMNPGGVRAELVFNDGEDSTGEIDGDVPSDRQRRGAPYDGATYDDGRRALGCCHRRWSDRIGPDRRRANRGRSPTPSQLARDVSGADLLRTTATNPPQ